MSSFDTFTYIVDYRLLGLKKRFRRIVAENGKTVYTGEWRWRMASVTDDMLNDSFFCVMSVFFADEEDEPRFD